jgi:hypothetical protein
MNSQTDNPFLEWTSMAFAPPPEDRQIIVTAWNGELERRDYNVVAYYKPMDLWYGGPGILVTREEIQYWAEIPGPTESQAQ